MTTPTPLFELGEALYGARWQRAMARALGVSERALQYWVAGAHPVPERVWPQLVGLAEARRAELQRLVKALSR